MGDSSLHPRSGPVEAQLIMHPSWGADSFTDVRDASVAVGDATPSPPNTGACWCALALHTFCCGGEVKRVPRLDTPSKLK